VQILPEFRDEPANLQLVRVRSQDGQLVPMTNAVRIVYVDGPVEIQREGRARTIVLSANPGLGVPLSELTVKLEKWATEVGIASPYQIVADGSARQMAEMGAGILFAFALSLVAIYMVLASLFNSLTQPFTIMMSAPFSFIGGFLALKLAGMPLDMMSGIGLLVLMGLVMKNGILVVDYINQLRAEGLSKEEAILRAGPVRMRPVLMTSIALIAGLVPVVTSDRVGAEFRAPMGVITIGGLATSTLLTLVMVPVIYSLIDSAETGVARLWRRIFAGRPAVGDRDVAEQAS
jgi:HAE1 family hydrophobic/amphiphilic exporter-1